MRWIAFLLVALAAAAFIGGLGVLGAPGRPDSVYAEAWKTALKLGAVSYVAAVVAGVLLLCFSNRPIASLAACLLPPAAAGVFAWLAFRGSS